MDEAVVVVGDVANGPPIEAKVDIIARSNCRSGGAWCEQMAVAVEPVAGELDGSAEATIQRRHSGRRFVWSCVQVKCGNSGIVRRGSWVAGAIVIQRHRELVGSCG